MKRLGTNSETHISTPSTPSTSTVTVKIEDDIAVDNVTEATEQTDKDESNIWKEKPADNLEKTREEEFEEYLADLLM